MNDRELITHIIDQCAHEKEMLLASVDAVVLADAVLDALAERIIAAEDATRSTLASYIAAEYYLDHEPHQDDDQHPIWGEVDNILAIVRGESFPIATALQEIGHDE